MNNIQCIANNTIQFTLSDPLSDEESYNLVTLGSDNYMDIAITANGRIISLDCNDLSEAVSYLNELNLVEDIALIKHIIEYEIIHDENRIEIEFD